MNWNGMSRRSEWQKPACAYFIARWDGGEMLKMWLDAHTLRGNNESLRKLLIVPPFFLRLGSTQCCAWTTALIHKYPNCYASVTPHGACDWMFCFYCTICSFTHQPWNKCWHVMWQRVGHTKTSARVTLDSSCEISMAMVSNMCSLLVLVNNGAVSLQRSIKWFSTALLYCIKQLLICYSLIK